MLKFSEFPVKKSIFFLSAVLGMALFSNESFSQTENEKVEDHILRNSERPLLDEVAVTGKESSHTLPLPSKVPAATVKPATTTQVKRDLPAGGLIKEGESKKESPSTLSFNIFLYIVDKFKEDKAD